MGSDQRKDRGSAMLLCLIILLVLVGISGAYLSFSLVNSRKTNEDMFALQSLYIAESAAAMLISDLNNGAALQPVPNPVDIGGGSFTIPVVENFGTDNVDNDNDGQVDNAFEQNFVRVEIEGTFTDTTRRLEIILNRTAGGAFWNAVFAGNSSQDTTYQLDFGGTSSDFDVVQGDIYTGNDLLTSGYAQLLNEDGTGSGTAMYSGNYTDSSSNNTDPNAVQGTQNPLYIEPGQGNPNISVYEERALSGTPGYIHVSQDLDTLGSSGYAATGTWSGEAEKQILDVTEPAHLWRKNPGRNGAALSTGNFNDDRTAGYGDVNTKKDDYYLEDPTTLYRETLTDENGNTYSVNGTSAYHGNTISPPSTQYPDGGNNQVYFIDGNMWMSHDGLLNFKFNKPDPNEAMAMTVVVKGNINFTDNMLYDDSTMDGIALIAIEDPNMPNVNESAFSSNNAVLPNGQTVNAWLAEAALYNSDLRGLDPVNNVADRARAAQEYNRAYGSGNVYYGDPGSGTVDFFEGYMYAENNFYATGIDVASGTDRIHIFGNMTAGNKVLLDRNTSQGYKALEVILDPKIKNGDINLPDLPQTPGTGDGDWFIASWKQIP